MVDIAIGGCETPVFWIFGEVGFHVFVYLFLKVDAEFSVCADYDIGADTFVCGEISVGVGYPEVGGVVFYSLLC